MLCLIVKMTHSNQHPVYRRLEAMIEFRQVSKVYASAKQPILNDLSFRLESGELVFLTGHSGAGKSTLLKLISMIERPSTGDILVKDRSLADISRYQIPYHRRTIGVVFQNHQLLMDRSLFDNVALPMQIQGYEPEEIKRRVRAALDRVGLLGREQAMPLELSGGEQQRVGIARAVVNRPKVLLADEPTGNLDPQLSSEVMRLFERFSQVGTTVLIATHDLDLVRQMGHRQLHLKQGRLVQDVVPGLSA
jgi:cell division transport system ATP-binding protein